MTLKDTFRLIGVNVRDCTAIELKALVETIIQIEELSSEERSFLVHVYKTGPIHMLETNVVERKKLIDSNLIVAVSSEQHVKALMCTPIMTVMAPYICNCLCNYHS